MKNLYFALTLGLIMPGLAFAGGAGYSLPAAGAAQCSGVFNVATLQDSKPAGVATVEMRHISDLSRGEQQDLASMKGSGSLEAEFHRGSNNCWYMLLKTMSSGQVRSASTSAANVTSFAGTAGGNDYYSYYTYRRNTTSNNTNNSTVGSAGVIKTSTVFRTKNDMTFSLFNVIEFDAAPSDATMTIEYANMTEAQQASLIAFFGAKADGATIYQRLNGNWYIVFN